MDRKQRQVFKHTQDIKHQRSPDEEKKLRRDAKSDKIERDRRAKRLRRQVDEDEPAIERLSSVRSRGRGGSKREAPAAPITEHEAEEVEGHEEGLVTSLSQGRARVRIQGVVIDAWLSGSIARYQQSRIAVGDSVFVLRSGQDAARVVAVRPRSSALIRPDPDDPRRERVLAANIDVAVIVLAAGSRRFQRRLIDRFLVAIERGGANALVCINKCDRLIDDESRIRVEEVLEAYRRIDIPVILGSARDGDGIDGLRMALKGKTAVLLGPSGVGKSSLLNRIDPGGARETKDVRESDGKGRHTTTSSELRETEDGTRVIDTPGIRAFGLQGIDREELRFYFPEFEDEASHCHFRDCLHLTEPDCGVQRAVDEGVIPGSRFDAYRRIAESLEQQG